MKVKIGSRKYLVEENPIGSVEIKEPILVLWGFDRIFQLDYTWKSGYVGSVETYIAKVTELNGSDWFHVSANELYRVIITSSDKLNKRFSL